MADLALNDPFLGGVVRQPSAERQTFTISASFAASAAKTVPEPNDQASSVADLAME
jgi:hypothetical protein